MDLNVRNKIVKIMNNNVMNGRNNSHNRIIYQRNLGLVKGNFKRIVSMGALDLIILEILVL